MYLTYCIMINQAIVKFDKVDLLTLIDLFKFYFILKVKMTGRILDLLL